MKLLDSLIGKGISPVRLTVLLSVPFVAGLAVLFVILWFIDKRTHQQHFELQLKESARAYFEQILVARLWNSMHGGVYVEVTEKTQPNPYLVEPERDIVAESGKKYTKINPAYMTRQLSDIASEKGSYKFRITGLRPLNPVNEPTPWERDMLGSFEKGEEEGYGIVEMEGGEYFGYMAPLRIEKTCLGCHGNEGYRLGDVRGGISIYIPERNFAAIHKGLEHNDFILLSFVGLFSVSFIAMVIWFLSRKFGRAVTGELEAERLRSAVQLSGAAAHELRQPLTVITGLSEQLREKMTARGVADKDFDIVISQCGRMDGIITRLLNIMNYRTKLYDGGSEIFDLDTEPETGEQKKDQSI
jgi:hypothetical protein